MYSIYFIYNKTKLHHIECILYSYFLTNLQCIEYVLYIQTKLQYIEYILYIQTKLQ